jgi:hypothetical protein
MGLNGFSLMIQLQAALPPCYILFSITQAMDIILHEKTTPNYVFLQTHTQKSEHNPVPDRENCIYLYIPHIFKYQAIYTSVDNH